MFTASRHHFFKKFLKTRYFITLKQPYIFGAICRSNSSGLFVQLGCKPDALAGHRRRITTDCGDSIQITYNCFALPVSFFLYRAGTRRSFFTKLLAGIVPPNTKERLPLPGDALYTP